ncbi:MAG: PepSY domain-containing protein [Gammaproteobacteria bacterium]
MTSREVWIRLHRYAGLAMALFLTIAGLTGSMIAFNHELDEWLNPELFHVSSRAAPLPYLEIGGLPGRIVICITGIVVTMLSVTGIVIWLQKRRTRQVRGAHSPLNDPARHALGTASHEHD